MAMAMLLTAMFYSVEKFKYYGQLSGRNIEDMMAGARVDVDDRKHNPMDFALWKSAKPGEPAWDVGPLGSRVVPGGILNALP